MSGVFISTVKLLVVIACSISSDKLSVESLKMKKAKKRTIFFNATKSERYGPKNDMGRFYRRLCGKYRVKMNKEQITGDLLNASNISLLILACSTEMFTTQEFDAIKQYISEGGNILVLLDDGGTESNLNFLLEQYGISYNKDSLIRTVYRKYFHPKEVLLTSEQVYTNKGFAQLFDFETNSVPPLVYPYGCTLNTARPGTVLLSSGKLCYPVNRPIISAYENFKDKNEGRICVLGSSRVFTDEYFSKEDNEKLALTLISWLMKEKDALQIDPTSAIEPDIDDYNFIPSTEALSNTVLGCIEESEEISNDLHEIVGSTSSSCFGFNLDQVPLVLRAHETLNVKREKLDLIKPEFETPYPNLKPATFDVIFPEPEELVLEKFDLDTEFASPEIRMSQVMRKCTDNDLEFFIKQVGDILNITKDIENENKYKKEEFYGEFGAKIILHQVVKTLIKSKMRNNEAKDKF